MYPMILLMIIFVPFMVNSYYINNERTCVCRFTGFENATFSCYSNINPLTVSSFHSCKLLSKTLRHLIVHFKKVTNHTSILEKGAFQNMPLLSSINLAELGLSSLSVHAFTGLKNVEVLNLSDNELTVLPIGIFANLTSLKKLYIRNNRIHYINPLVLKPLVHLTHLSLFGNDIRYVDPYTFSNLTHLKSVDIRENSLACYCSNDWLVNNVIIVTDYNLHCPHSSLGAETNCSSGEVITVTTVNETTAYYFNTLLLDCLVESSQPYSVVWLSSRGMVFANKHQQPWVPGEALVDASFNIPPKNFPVVVRVDVNHRLSVNHFRGFFAGDWHCLVYSHTGNASSISTVNILSYIVPTFIWALVVGFATAGGLLAVGIVVGCVRYMDETRCCTEKIERGSEKPPVMEVIPVPDDHEYGNDVTGGGGGAGSANQTRYSPVQEGAKGGQEDLWGHGGPVDGEADVDLVFRDEGMANEYASRLEGLASSAADPLHFRERLMELRGKMRRDVGPKFSIMRSKMRLAHRESVQRMQSLRSSSSEAAQRMRVSLHNGMDSVRFQMKSVAQLCGAVNLGQTISVISIYSDGDRVEQEREIKQFIFK